jgi:riboflavin synthase
MFTGIIQETGRLTALRRTSGGMTMTIDAPLSSPELAIGDSLAVSGVCLTVVQKSGTAVMVDVVEETLSKTTLGRRRQGDGVNLELSLRLNDRLGGHLVLGHVDCTGRVTGVTRQPEGRLITIAHPPEFARLLIPVGSIAVDGISLTVARLGEGEFTVAIIPHTLEMTTLAGVETGTEVNLEFDVIGKYVASFMGGKKGDEGGVTWEKLRQWGYP